MDLKYFGDILLHKILRKNLPGRVAGDHLFFTKDENDRYSLFVNDKDGSLKECTYNGELAKQIGVLSKDKADKTYVDTQDNALDGRITALSNDRGYLNSKILTNGTDLNTIWENGIYQVDTSNCTNVPKVYGAGYLFVNGSSSGYTTQRFIYLDSNGTEHKRIKNGTWQSWSELATTDKIDISLPYNAEFITNEENRYVSKLVKTSLNKVTAYVSVKRTDGQMFKANTDYQIAILPIGWKNKGNNQCLGSASNLNGISIGSARIAVFDGTLFTTTFIDCYSMMFTVEYELIV